jgi:hypothetical protein
MGQALRVKVGTTCILVIFWAFAGTFPFEFRTEPRTRTGAHSLRIVAANPDECWSSRVVGVRKAVDLESSEFDRVGCRFVSGLSSRSPRLTANLEFAAWDLNAFTRERRPGAYGLRCGGILRGWCRLIPPAVCYFPATAADGRAENEYPKTTSLQSGASVPFPDRVAAFSIRAAGLGPD